MCRRQSEIDARARDVRLQRALEEVDRFKTLLQEQRAADKDHKDVNKSEYNRLFAGESEAVLRRLTHAGMHLPP